MLVLDILTGIHQSLLKFSATSKEMKQCISLVPVPFTHTTISI